MNEFDHKLQQATKQWLTSVLTQNGYLESGHVTELNQHTSRIGISNTSEFFKLDIRYSSDSSGKPPPECLMKASKPDRFQPCKKEAQYYDFIRGRQSPSVAEAYATSVDEELQSAIILLEDKGSGFAVTDCVKSR